VVRIRNGIQTTEAIAGENEHGNLELLKIDLGPPTDELFLTLFGTGLRFRTALTSVKATITYSPQVDLPVQYAGPQNEFAGVDQINVSLPRLLAGRNFVGLEVRVDGEQAIYTWLAFK